MPMMNSVKTVLVKTGYLLLMLAILWGWTERQIGKQLTAAENAGRMLCEKEHLEAKMQKMQQQHQERLSDATQTIKVWMRPHSRLSVLLERMRDNRL